MSNTGNQWCQLTGNCYNIDKSKRQIFLLNTDCSNTECRMITMSSRKVGELTIWQGAYRLYLRITFLGLKLGKPSPTSGIGTVQAVEPRSLLHAVWLPLIPPVMWPMALWIVRWNGRAAPVPLVRGLGVAANRSVDICTYTPLFAFCLVSMGELICSRLRSTSLFLASIDIVLFSVSLLTLSNELLTLTLVIMLEFYYTVQPSFMWLSLLTLRIK